MVLCASACASGSEAVAYGCQLLATNQADVVIVGGTESPINPVTFQGFDDMGALAKGASYMNRVDLFLQIEMDLF